MPTYYQLGTMQKKSPDFCYVRRRPAELGLDDWKLGKGEPIGPARPPALTLKMAAEDAGMQLTSFIGNTASLLIVDRAVCDVIRKMVTDDEVEFLQVSIVNHRGRVASSDYYIVNPLGVYDVLNLQLSKIKYHEGAVVSVKEITLDPKKMAGKPHVIRLREDPTMYFISAAVFEELRKLQPKPTNGSPATYPEVASTS